MSESMEGYDYDMRSKRDPRCTVDLKMYHEVKTISKVLYRSKELFQYIYIHTRDERIPNTNMVGACFYVWQTL